MAGAPRVAHSLTEACLYLKATPCGSCGRGPLAASQPCVTARPGGTTLATFETTCDACQAVATVTLGLHEAAQASNDETTSINPTDQPSELIDVAGWLTLYRMIHEDAAREADRTQARRLDIEAGQCLEEALKFYDEVDNDLPPQEAFFREATRRRFRENPEQFSRQRLINLRAKLPFLSASRLRCSSPEGKGGRFRWRRSR